MVELHVGLQHYMSARSISIWRVVHFCAVLCKVLADVQLSTQCVAVLPGVCSQ